MPLKYIWTNLGRVAEQVAAGALAAEATAAGLPSELPFEAKLHGLIAEIAAGSVGGVAASSTAMVRGWVHATETMDETGAANIFAALDTIKSAYSGVPVTLRWEGGVYRIGTAIDLGTNFHMRFDGGARIKVDGVRFRYKGTIDAPISQIFECVNGGTVEFYDAAQGVGALIPDVWLDWFGAKGDGVTPDDAAYDAAFQSIRGQDQDPLVVASFPRGRLAMRPGGIYIATRPWVNLSTVGGHLRGGGPESTELKYIGGSETFTAQSYPAADQVQLANVGLPADLVGRWIVMEGPDHYGLAREIVEHMGAGLVRVAGSHGYTDANQDVRLLHRAVYDLQGCHHSSTEDFSFTFPLESRVMSAYYYHRDSRVTARGSSRGHTSRVTVGSQGNIYVAAFAIGSFHPGEYSWQEDLHTAWGCIAQGNRNDYLGPPHPTPLEAIWDQNAFRFGAGVTFANPLNYTCHGCVALKFGNGVAVLLTNVRWDGGTIQSNQNDIYLSQGLQNYASFGGFRTEGSRRLIYGFTTGSAGFHIHLYDIEYRAENTGPDPDGFLTPSGHPMYCWGVLPLRGTAILEGIRVVGSVRTLDPVPYPDSEAPYTAIGVDGGGNGWVEINTTGVWAANELEQGMLNIKDTAGLPGTGNWWGHFYEILSNTATAAGVTRFTIKGPWTTGSAGETGFAYQTLAPNGTTRKVFVGIVTRLRANSACSVQVEGCQWPHLNRSQWQVGGLDWHIVNSPACDYGAAPLPWAREGEYRIGRETLGIQDFETPTNTTLTLQWTQARYGRVLLTGNYVIPLGGNAWSVDPTNYPQVPFPPFGGRLVIEATQDGTGGRTLTFDTTKTIKWKGGAAPATSWGANIIRKYVFEYRVTHYLAELVGEYS